MSNLLKPIISTYNTEECLFPVISLCLMIIYPKLCWQLKHANSSDIQTADIYIGHGWHIVRGAFYSAQSSTQVWMETTPFPSVCPARSAGSIDLLWTKQCQFLKDRDQELIWNPNLKWCSANMLEHTLRHLYDAVNRNSGWRWEGFSPVLNLSYFLLSHYDSLYGNDLRLKCQMAQAQWANVSWGF